MLSIAETKALISDPNITDKDAQEIRDACYQLAAIFFDAWADEEAVKKSEINDENSTLTVPCAKQDSE